MATSNDHLDGGVYESPFQRLSAEYRSVLSVVEGAASVCELPSVVAGAERIVAKPAADRFSLSRAQIESAVGLEESDGAVVGRIARTLGRLGGERTVAKLLRILDHLLSRMQAAALEQVVASREQSQDAMILALYVQRALDVQDALAQRLETSADSSRLFACWVALLSRLVLVGEGRYAQVTDGMLRDIQLSGSRLAQQRGREPSHEPLDASISELRQETLLDAAVLAYESLDLSVSRGAELSETSVTEFEAALDDEDARPRYGPDDSPELFEGSDALD